MFALVAYTGMRRSEMARSRIEDIDLAAKLVRVTAARRCALRATALPILSRQRPNRLLLLPRGRRK
jgi:integrase